MERLVFRVPFRFLVFFAFFAFFALALRRIKLYHEIERIAVTDSLTELHTRRYTTERFQEELKRSQARGMKLSFLMIDVDHFKAFNDQHGHLMGDQILR